MGVGLMFSGMPLFLGPLELPIPVHLRAQEYRLPAAAEVLRIPRQMCFQGPLAKGIR